MTYSSLSRSRRWIAASLASVGAIFMVCAAARFGPFRQDNLHLWTAAAGYALLAVALVRNWSFAAGATLGVTALTAGFLGFVAVVDGAMPVEAALFTVGNALAAVSVFQTSILRSRHGWTHVFLGAAAPGVVAVGSIAYFEGFGSYSYYYGDSEYWLALAGAGIAVLGGLGITRNRTWGILAVLSGAFLIAVHSGYARYDALQVLSLFTAAMLLLTFVPFARPIYRFLRTDLASPSVSLE